MDQNLKVFALQWVGVVLSTLMFVLFVAFSSMPFTLGFHPGEATDRADAATVHMT